MSGHVNPTRLVGELLPAEVAHVASCPLCQAEARLAKVFADALPSQVPIRLPARATVAPEPTAGAERFVELAPIGEGGMGEVVRVQDPTLGRSAAMKVLGFNRIHSRDACLRFEREARVTAQLQHPGIVPVYEFGVRPDGRPFYTMLEVTGHTLGYAIRQLHGAGLPSVQPLVRAFLRVCEAMGYAHARGVLHRDLKPGNVMLGTHGEVRVVDWGLARIGEALQPVAPVETKGPTEHTMDGTVAGTAAYMPPEQARGDLDALGPWSDVYSLGAILFEILSGRPPYVGRDTDDVVSQVLESSEPVLPDEVDPDLGRICRHAMSRSATLRPANAGALADEVRAWLEGERSRERALDSVAAADRAAEDGSRLRARAVELRAAAAAMLEDIPAHAPVDDKLHGWLMQDQAAQLEVQADHLDGERLQRLGSALTDAPGLAEAHTRLADHFAARHAEAEARGDTRAAAHLEVRLRAHDRLQGRHAAYLAGAGSISVRSDPPGARVMAHRYELHRRRLIPDEGRDLGLLPLSGQTLASGSWLLVLTHSNREPVKFPVVVERGGHTHVEQPVALPVAGTLGADEVYVPAGWFWSGAETGDLPRRQLWCDAFVIERFVVTNERYLAFLDSLAADGQEDKALRLAPRERGTFERPGVMIYGRTPSGRFQLVPDADGDVWSADWPVMGVTWAGARAFAAWRSERTGRPWRLPFELEWEKAARGVDGRRYPWGDFMDPTWSCNRQSAEGRSLPASVDGHPVDCSPWGVRGMAGNVRERCLDAVVGRLGPAVSDDLRVLRAVPEAPPALHPLRGGSWADPPVGALTRSAVPSDVPGTRLGFRLARSWPS